MVDWMPFAFVLSMGVFSLLWLLLEADDGAGRSTGDARKAYWGTVALTAALYVVYLAFGEAWLWS